MRNNNYAVESPFPARRQTWIVSRTHAPYGGSCGWQPEESNDGQEQGARRQWRVGAVNTLAGQEPGDGKWTKRDDKSGKFMDQKADDKPFKGVRKEKKGR